MGRVSRFAPDYTDSKCTISNNTFRIFGDDLLGNDNQDLTTTMGVRIAKFPQVLHVTNNTFIGAPLILKWTWNCPYFSTNAVVENSKDNIGFSMDITGNTFVGADTASTMVDINPATGFGHEIGANGTRTAGYPQPNLSQWVTINFTNNTVENPSYALRNDPYPYTSVVRFWFPNRDSWCANNPPAFSGGHVDNSTFYWLHPYDTTTSGTAYEGCPGGFGWSQNYISASITAHDNSLRNSYFILTWDQTGGDTSPVENDNEKFELMREDATAEKKRGRSPGGLAVTKPCYHWLSFKDNRLTNFESSSILVGAGAATMTSLLGHTDFGKSANEIPNYFDLYIGGGGVHENRMPYDLDASQEYGVVRYTSVSIGDGSTTDPTVKLIEMSGSGIGQA